MRAQFRFWLAVSLLLVAGVIILRWKERASARLEGELNAAVTVAPSLPKAPELTTTPAVISTYLANKGELAPVEKITNRAPYRLSNTSLKFKELSRKDTAILMGQAWIDTAEAVNLPIPAHLKAGENPGAYLVQSRGAAAGAFQKTLRAAGADVVSYAANNAYLVKATKAVAENLRAEKSVGAVLPYEPYYKIDSRLMKFAVEEKSLEEETWLRVTLFPGATAETLRPLAREVGITEPSPFGPQVLIHPLTDVLPDLAQLAEVQLIEPWRPRTIANDLTRVRMGVSEDTKTNGNYLGLMGSNTWVNVNDVGVDQSHPDLKDKVFYQGTNATTDPEGHGTHVAATIAGLGAIATPFDNITTNINPDRLTTDGTNTFIDMSYTNGATMRGLAPQAKLFVLPVSLGPERNTPVTDTYLIDTAARTNYVTMARTNTLISNNSWTYANTVDYDSQAARFDAATRDALPDVQSPQPVLYVFAAGNNGNGNEDGNGGEPGRITSPGTAKNVITVGALEAPRFIAQALTNIVVVNPGTTNAVTNTNTIQIFRPTTDSASDVASFSSRGNVGIGIEGDFGRFKPDLVAPGTFILSARSAQWDLKNDYSPTASEISSNLYLTISNLNSVATKYRYDSGTSFSAPAVSGLLALVEEFFSQKLPTDLRRNLSPAMLKGLLINSARNVHPRYDFEVQNIINYQGWGLATLPNVVNTNMLDHPEKDWTMRMVDQSPANALATGQAHTWDVGFTTNSAATGLRVTLVWTDPPGNPAVGVKLVNDLDLVVESGGTLWHGNDFLSNKRTTEPRGYENSLTNKPGGVVFGDSRFRDNINNVENVYIPGGFGTNISIHVIGRRVNVRAINNSINEVNDIDEVKQDFALIVSSDYRGTDANDKPVPPFTKFEQRGGRPDFGFLKSTVMTNGLPLLNQRIGANGRLLDTNGSISQWNFYIFTNNDANVNGFHTSKAGEYVAFVTFTPPNLSVPRNLEADLDLFVSKDSQLTNLDSGALSAAWHSVSRLGTEQVLFAPTVDITNELGVVVDRAKVYPAPGGVVVGQAHTNDVFYIAVKSEDQQAAEFSLIALSSDTPFEQERNGSRVLTAMPVSDFIPDGLPNKPNAATAIAIGLSDVRTRDANVFMRLNHQLWGDLLGSIQHQGNVAILNNHNLFSSLGGTGSNAVVFTDDPNLDRNLAPPANEYIAGLTPNNVWYSDGPGFLESFAGAKSVGPWIFQMIDNAFSHTGRVDLLEVHLKPIPEIGGNGTNRGTVGANSQSFYLLDVPANAKSLNITLRQIPGSATPPLELFVRKELIPSTNDFDYHRVITPPADSTQLRIDRNTYPPLLSGTYFIGIFNNGAAAVDYELVTFMELDDAGANVSRLGDTNIQLTDDAVTSSVRNETNDYVVAGVAVQLLARDILESDLVLHLVSPQGTRVLLSENRGSVHFDGFGSKTVTTNATGDVFLGPSYAVFTDEPLGQLPIKFATPPFGDSSTNRGPVTGNGFEGAVEGNYSAPSIVDGWNVDTNTVAIVSGNAHSGLNYLNTLRRGSVSRTLPTVPGRSYKLTFAYRSPPPVTGTFVAGSTNWISLPRTGPVFGTGQIEDAGSPFLWHTNAPMGTVDLHYRVINSPDTNFISGTNSEMWVAITNEPPFATWFSNDTNSQWISLAPRGANHPPGVYTNRTSFSLDEDPVNFRINGRMSADDGVLDILVNGVSTGFSSGGSTNYHSPPFTLTGPFRIGVNTIDFLVVNVNAAMGLRVDLSASLIGGPVVTNGSSVGPTSAEFFRLKTDKDKVTSFAGSSGWKIFEQEFVAAQTPTLIQFYSGDLPGVDIDSIQLIDSGTLFLQPEEPLAILEGERAMGEWRLEAYDNNTQIANHIDSWTLILNRAPAILPAEALANGGQFPGLINSPAVQAGTNYYTPGILRRGEVQWFYFDVCSNATTLSVRLRPSRTLSTNNYGTPIEFLIDRSGFPTGSPDTDDYPIYVTPSTTNLVLTFTTNSPAWAPLRPGTRMFFGVRNQDFLTTNTFSLRMDSDGTCGFTPPTPIVFNKPIENTALAGQSSNHGDNFTLASPAASSVEISLQDPGTLTAVASTTGQPTPSSYEVRQTVSSSGTLALPYGGNWKIAVFNNGSTDVNYTLLATSGPIPVPILDTHVAADGKFQVTWQSEPGRQYEIAVSTDAAATVWTPVTTVTASGATATFSDSSTATLTKRFYRIRPL
jgi:hypothetical protein